MHRSRTPGRGQREGARHVVAGARRILDRPRGLDDRPRDRHLVDLLERALPALAARTGAAQQQHGRLRHAGPVEGGDGVQMAGPGGDQGDTRLFCQAAPGVGHVHGGGLVPRVDQRDVAADRRVVDGQDLIAGQREDPAHAGGDQRLDDAPGAGHSRTTAVRISVSSSRVAASRAAAGGPTRAVASQPRRRRISLRIASDVPGTAPGWLS